MPREPLFEATRSTVAARLTALSKSGQARDESKGEAKGEETLESSLGDTSVSDVDNSASALESTLGSGSGQAEPKP